MKLINLLKILIKIEKTNYLKNLFENKHFNPMEEEIQNHICPITLKIFRDPYVASDGFAYEKTAIIRWLDIHNRSPMTNQEITNNIMPCTFFQRNIKQLFEKYPQLYFSEYHNIDITEFMDETIIKKMTDEEFEKMINAVSLEELNNERKNGMLLVHYVCKFGTSNKVKIIIDKGVDLKCKTDVGWKLIHFICKKMTSEIIKHVIDEIPIDELVCHVHGYKPIHLLFRYSTFEAIKHIIDKGVDLECQIHDGRRPIHFACHYSTPEAIKYLIDKGVDLECQSNNGCKPIHFICRFSTPEMLKYILSKGVNFKSKANDELTIINLIQMNKKMPHNLKQYICEKFDDISNDDIINFIENNT